MAVTATLALDIEVRVPDVPITSFDSTKRESAITEAFSWYSSRRESTVIEDIVGSDVFDLALPGTFDQEHSRMQTVEYPAGERTPCYLPASKWLIYDPGISDKVLRLLDATPTPFETVRVTFTAPYSIATLPVEDEFIIINLGCSLYCEWIAANYADSNRGSLSLDSAEHVEQHSSYVNRAQRFRDIAYDGMGIELAAGADGRMRGHGSGSGGGGGLSSATSIESVTVPYRTARAAAGGLTH